MIMVKNKTLENQQKQIVQPVIWVVLQYRLTVTLLCISRHLVETMLMIEFLLVGEELILFKSPI